ncbi:lipocalin-like domain-containing protein [Candidatus Berkiella cookevillensis]|uniref:Lipocalin-like domain-containing protein n=1 Tax=Candidatus Berkiella cookevillensis TaxID=437022 RepID=A0A0Q9YCD7_9GAMM|nr:lipocalin-like domain-containing protein [Candidatus Berkiella cookevillensis]MCS5708648.1 lipocalin-like domain-containing protein [Candidatus Berkiella cookevillensis]
MENPSPITKKSILGSWKLLDFHITQSNGDTKKWGLNPNGLLIYDESGYMSASINSGANIEESTQNLERNILFYSGQYKITGKNEITHFVDNASNPYRIGKEFIRNAKLLKKNQLQLIADGEYGRAYLLWEKL